MTFRSILFIDEIEKHPKNHAQKHERNTDFNSILLIKCKKNVREGFQKYRFYFNKIKQTKPNQY